MCVESEKDEGKEKERKEGEIENKGKKVEKEE